MRFDLLPFVEYEVHISHGVIISSCHVGGHHGEAQIRAGKSQHPVVYDLIYLYCNGLWLLILG